MPKQTPTKKSKFIINESRTLQAQGSWRETQHKLDEKSAYALEMALVTGRPLLIRGEPGIGKSQLARYAAEVLDRLFIAEVININTEGQDLLWRYDPVARLNDAQTQSKGDEEDNDLSPNNYLNPSILWWVYNWEKADEQYKKCRHKTYLPHCPDLAKRDNGMVLLLDEIDKADPSLPNSLLEVFGNGGFYVPMLGEYVSNNNNNKIPAPLVIITTNAERELPPAFLRRCLVLDMKLDDKEELHVWWHEQHEKDKEAYSEVTLDDFDTDEALIRWLGQERAEVHYPNTFSDTIKRQVAEYLIEDRHKAEYERVKPGQAEYLDLLAALDEMTPEALKKAGKETEKDAEQQRLLDKIRPYALAKGDY